MDKMQSPPATVTETRDEIAIAEEYDRVYMGANTQRHVKHFSVGKNPVNKSNATCARSRGSFSQSTILRQIWPRRTHHSEIRVHNETHIAPVCRTVGERSRAQGHGQGQEVDHQQLRRLGRHRPLEPVTHTSSRLVYLGQFRTRFGRSMACWNPTGHVSFEQTIV